MSVVDEVRDRLDIVAVVGEYVPLKKAGRTYKALCPFHSEKTASFVVFPASGTWRCFGACATGGDVFEFVMRMENVDFRAVLELLARRTGVELAPPSPTDEAETARRARLRAAMAAAAAFFHTQLMRAATGEPARAYLRARQFASDIASDFELGFAPDEWSAMGDALRGEGFTDDELLVAGLVRPRDSGGVYDAFRGRLMFPIRDVRGRAVGFGARTLHPAGVPKYLNSPQTPLFDKSHLLYGLDRAAAAIRESGRAVVVEGYTDVLRAHSAGFGNVVASLGTALTPHQIVLLKRYAPTLVLALDADAAGQAATLRGLEVARDATEGEVMPVPTARGWIRYEHRLEVALTVARLPAGQDPDDVIRADPANWQELIAGAQPVMAYLFDTLTRDLDLETPSDKAVAADRLMPLISGVPDPVARAAWLSRLAELIRVDERTLSGRLARPPDRRAGRMAGAVGPGAGLMDQANQANQADQADRPDRADRADRAGRSAAAPPRDRVNWLLGHLLVEPRRLRELNALLRADGQAAVGPHDAERTTDRDLLTAVRHAALGAPPPDAPPEQRLDALPEPLAEYAALLRERATAEPPLAEVACIASLRSAVLLMRKQKCKRTLDGLKYLQAEAAPDEHADYNARVEQIRAELQRLDRLLAPDLGPASGKVDVRLGL